LDLVKFVLFCSTLFMTALGGAAVCFAVSATVRTFAVANLVSAFVFVVMMVRPTFMRCLHEAIDRGDRSPRSIAQTDRRDDRCMFTRCDRRDDRLV